MRKDGTIPSFVRNIAQKKGTLIPRVLRVRIYFTLVMEGFVFHHCEKILIGDERRVVNDKLLQESTLLLDKKCYSETIFTIYNM